ncbi:MAG: sortase B protein-sorting domain-containing protein [Clostridiales bacterium]|nr:sortase B protein-sorting domain-containing protein [Candidatus Crickella caballi]
MHSEPEEPTPGDDDNTGSDTSDNPDDTTGGGTTDSTGDNTGGELTDNPDAATGDGSNFGVGDGSGADSNIHATNAAVSSDDDSSTNLDNRDDFPKTGDNAPLVIYTVLLLSSALGALPLIKKKLKG